MTNTIETPAPPKISPILFSTPMVKAILEGRKTQTRRIVKYKKRIQDPWIGFTCFTGEGEFSVRGMHENEQFGESFFKLPIQKDDILWVRETWRVGAWRDEDWKVAFDYKASPELKKTPWSEYNDNERFQKIMDKTIDELDAMGIERTVDEEAERFWYNWNPGESPLKWKPSIFMPKEAARIFLRVTDVRVERLQDISSKDAEAEGAKDHLKFKELDALRNLDWIIPSPFSEYQFGFLSIWCEINGMPSWLDNPWVWVYEFERTDKPENF